MADAPPEPMAAAAAVERRIVTVLFADLVGFTTLSEQLDAEDVASLQDAYFAAARETIQRHGGSVEKFIGDAVMAVFGIPRTLDDDAERAVRAGLALIGAVEQLAARLGLDAGSLRIRVGVNTGEVVHATSGPDAGRVTGDTVNTAARLQTASQPNRVLLGELTALAVGEAIDLDEPTALELKGKAQAVRGRLVLGMRPAPSRDAALGELRAPLVGREAELVRISGVRGGRITVIAPPGVGKSRLMGAVASLARERGDLVLRARVRPSTDGPYDTVAALLREAGADDGLQDALRTLPMGRRDAVTRAVGALLAPSSAGPEDMADAGEREIRIGAWIEALAALTGPRHATWIVEDVHWAGGDLLAFLEKATSNGHALVCTSRPSILDGSPDWVSAGEQLELSTLPAATAAELIRAFVGDAIPQSLVAAITERSDGNPLFIEELLRAWASVGTLSRGATGWKLMIDPGQVALPGTVQAIYASQLDDLPGDARLVARRASVAGRRFAEAALESLALLPNRDGLEVLRHRQFITGPEADEVLGDVFAYRHALLRDAAYASLARAERARLHAALAKWLAEAAGDRVADVALNVAEHHAAAAESVPALAVDGLSRSEMRRSAAIWFERAADAALAMAAPSAAIDLLARALGYTEPDARLDIARLRLRRGEVLASSAALDEAVVEMSAAMDELSQLLPDEADLFAEAAYHLGLAYMQQIRFLEAEQLAKDANERLSGMDAQGGIARLMALHAWSVAAQGRNEGSGDEARQALEIGQRLADPHLQVDLLEHFASTTDELGIGSFEAWEQLAERALQVGRCRQATIGHRARASIEADRHPERALRMHAEAATVAEEHGLTEQQGWADLALCETLFVLGEWDAALEAGERALRLGEQYAYERLAFRTWVVLLPILAARRDASRGERYLTWWAMAAPHFGANASPYSRVLQASIPIWLAQAAGGPVEDPPTGLSDVPPFSNPHFLAAREILAEGYLRAGDVQRASTMATQDRDETRLMHISRSLIGSWISAATGDHEGARSMATDAANRARELGAAWWLARALRAAKADDEAQQIESRLKIAHPAA